MPKPMKFKFVLTIPNPGDPPQELISTLGDDIYHSLHDSTPIAGGYITPQALVVTRDLTPAAKFQTTAEEEFRQVADGVAFGTKQATSVPDPSQVGKYLWTISRSEKLDDIWQSYLQKVLMNRDFMDSYQEWVAVQKKAFLKNNPGAIVPPEIYSFREYMDVCRGARKAIIDSLGGTLTRGAPNPPEFTRAQHAGNWPGLWIRPLPLAPDPKALDHTLALVKDPGKVRVVFQRRFLKIVGSDLIEANFPPEILLEMRDEYAKEITELTLNALHRFTKGSKEWILEPDWDEKILSFLDKDGLRKLIGDQKLHEEEVIERLADCADFLNDISQQLLFTIKDFWSITGVHSFMEMAFTRAGKQHAYVYEWVILQRKYVSRLGLQEAEKVVYCGQKVDGKAFADFIEARKGVDDAGKPVTYGDIGEAKSYEKGQDLTGPDGEMLRQVGSHSRRMWDANGGLIMKLQHDGSPVVEEAIFSRKVTFFVNSNQLNPVTPKENLANWADYFAQETQKINGWLTNTSKVPSQGADPLYDEVMKGSRLFEAPVNKKVDEAIVALRGDPNYDLTIQRALLLRITADPSTGAIKQDLVEELLKKNPPLEVVMELEASPIRYNNP